MPNEPDNTISYHESLDRRLLDAQVMLDLLRSVRGRPITADDSILDVGCGPPETSQRLWNNEQQCPNRLVGIDISKEYGKHPFWNTENRAFKCHGFFEEADVLKQNSDKFKVIWSCFSAHCITAESSVDPIKLSVEQKIDHFFRYIAKLLESDGVFACQIPAVDDFFPAITHLAQKAFRQMKLDYDAYLSLRNKYYSFWNDFEKLKPVVEKAGLQILLDTSMSSWRLLGAEQSFYTWWSANVRILKEMDLFDHQQLFQAWKSSFQESVLSRELAFSEKLNKALGCLYARNLLITHREHDFESPLPKSSKPSRIEDICTRATPKAPLKTRIGPSDEREVSFNLDNFKFEKYNEPVIGALVRHSCFKDKTLYCMTLITDEVYRVFFNSRYEHDNSVRQVLLSRIKEPGGAIPFERISPQLGEDHTGVVLWFASEMHKYAFHLLSPVTADSRFQIVNLISIHSITNLEYDLSRDFSVPDILLDACAERGFISLISHGISHREIYGKSFQDKPSAEGMFYHLAWQSLYCPHHVALYAHSEDSGEKKTAVLTLKLSQKDTEYLVDSNSMYDSIKGVRITARHASITNRTNWVREETVDNFLDFFLCPFRGASWPSCWYHSNLGVSALHESMKSFLKSDDIDPISTGKCLFMVNESETDEPTWYHERNPPSELDRGIRKVDLESVLNKLGFNDGRLFPVDLKFDSAFRFPIIPALPFLLSLRQFVETLMAEDERCKNDDPAYENLCFYKIKGTSRYGIRLLLHKWRLRSGERKDVTMPPNLADRFWDSQLFSGDWLTEGKLLPALIRLVTCQLLFLKETPREPWQMFFKGKDIHSKRHQDEPTSHFRHPPFLVGLRMNQDYPEVCLEWNDLSK